MDGHWWIEVEVGMKALAGMSSRLGVHRISNIDDRGFRGNLLDSFVRPPRMGWAGVGEDRLPGWGKGGGRWDWQCGINAE